MCSASTDVHALLYLHAMPIARRASMHASLSVRQRYCCTNGNLIGSLWPPKFNRFPYTYKIFNSKIFFKNLEFLIKKNVPHAWEKVKNVVAAATYITKGNMKEGCYYILFMLRDQKAKRRARLCPSLPQGHAVGTIPWSQKSVPQRPPYLYIFSLVPFWQYFLGKRYSS